MQSFGGVAGRLVPTLGALAGLVFCLVSKYKGINNSGFAKAN
jgi:hypothetical protein